MTQEKELKQAINLIEAGNKSEALPILKTILKKDRNNELAWIWLSGCVDKSEDKIFCFTEALRVNPNNETTKVHLHRLEENIKELQQQEYKNKIEKLFLEIRENSEINTVLENFFPRIPMIIFLRREYYSLFEYVFTKDYDIGQKNLWSSDADLRNARDLFESCIHHPGVPYLSPALKVVSCLNKVNSFVNDDLVKMKKFLKRMIVYENDCDYTFILLRLLQCTAPSYYSQVFMQICNADFGNIEELSLEECLFLYFSKVNNQAFDNLFEDPSISLFTYFILNYKKFGNVENIDYYNYIKRRDELIKLLNEKKEDFDYRIFEASIKKKAQIIEEGCSITDVDLMSGEDFEKFVAKIFTKLGYMTIVTKHSGDFGVDVIAEKDGTKIAIQAKCFANPVSNSAIQEITAGMNYYKCQKGVVVTNRTFTKAAIELARSNSIQLWDRKILIEKISEIF
ncbi:MAG: restriction endonuclease [Bacteroidales bacterium]